MSDWPALDLSFPASPASEIPLPELVAAALDGLGVVAIEETDDSHWRVVFREDAARSHARETLADAVGLGLAMTPSDVADGNWAARSQAALCAIRVGQVIVTPPWDLAATRQAPDAITVIVEPGMGFGSGHHATTRLCLAALQRLDLRGQSVLDIGTGSGVLAITAALLGAAQVLGIDVDPDALGSARSNATLNGDPPVLALRLADFRVEPLPRAHLVLANLTGSMLTAGAELLTRLVYPGGHLILSGITEEESASVVGAFTALGTVECQTREGEWVGLVVRV